MFEQKCRYLRIKMRINFCNIYNIPRDVILKVIEIVTFVAYFDAYSPTSIYTIFRIPFRPRDDRPDAKSQEYIATSLLFSRELSHRT